MFKRIAIVIMLAFIGCSEPGSPGSGVNMGEAVITIDRITYPAEAILDTKTLGETIYQKITLVVSDTFYVDILNENFEEDIYIWTGESFSADGTMIFLISRNLGGIYNPHEGFLIITGITESTITGNFKLGMYDTASSCVMSPEADMEFEGGFFAVAPS